MSSIILILTNFVLHLIDMACDPTQHADLAAILLHEGKTSALIMYHQQRIIDSRLFVQVYAMYVWLHPV